MSASEMLIAIRKGTAITPDVTLDMLPATIVSPSKKRAVRLPHRRSHSRLKVFSQSLQAYCPSAVRFALRLFLRFVVGRGTRAGLGTGSCIWISCQTTPLKAGGWPSKPNSVMPMTGGGPIRSMAGDAMCESTGEASCCAGLPKQSKVAFVSSGEIPLKCKAAISCVIRGPAIGPAPIPAKVLRLALSTFIGVVLVPYASCIWNEEETGLGKVSSCSWLSRAAEGCCEEYPDSDTALSGRAVSELYTVSRSIAEIAYNSTTYISTRCASSQS